MNTCLHYISKSIYKYFCFEIVIKIPFFLNTIFQTCESRFIKWHYPASYWSEHHPLTQSGVLPKMCLLSSCRWRTHEHRHLHTLMVFSKRGIILHIFSILFSTWYEFSGFIFASYLCLRFWHILTCLKSSFINLHNAVSISSQSVC